ncbi:c-type cytochrome [Accumulibacter sp.]|uniref:c-type cytochrome n=1 Tax=Accumulibacter sp. TaxID=2053492 RepID=UPI001E17FB4A|nr:c-type cytochrome [Accumulibacter sp.]MCB1932725.1 c-type cytochrome [Accumulibacter sp.]MCB1964790.1 c-type cytochrome [Accumulibacter sp.]MCP5227782.1 c-type cytochrome [Accumulibacter sp.]
MNRTSIRVALIAAGIALCGGPAFAEKQATDLGKSEYETNCAVCHGADGKGKGLMEHLLRTSPPDLTVLAKNNNGVFPTARLYEVIEGIGVPSHGSREMPIWGREYQAEAAQRYHEAHGQYDAQALVRARILLLIDYIGRMQVH